MEAKRDNNQITTLLAVSSVDGETPVTLYANPTTHRLLVSAVAGNLGDLSDATITSAAEGDIIYRNGSSAWVNLGIGTEGQVLTVSSGGIPEWADATGISAVVDDTTPQLGGNLDVNGSTITSASSGNVVIDPNGTGEIQLGASVVTVEQFIRHSGDANNQIEFGTDTQDFQTGGSSRMDISDSGVRLGGSGARVTTVLDEDDLNSDSATALATQQSIKAYADTKIGGSTGSNDNRLLRADGTGGVTAQSSGITVDDSDNVSGMGTLGVGAITSTGKLTVSLAGVAAQFTNSTDNASVQAAIFEGDRATPGDNDEVYVSLRLSHDGAVTSAAQKEFGRITLVATDVSEDSEDGRLDFAVITAGTLADKLQLDGAALAPSANDGLTLGTTALGFADLHLATGGTINFANGDAVLTHSTGIITVSTGDLRVTTAGTNAASVVTVGGTQTLTNKTLTSPTINSPTGIDDGDISAAAAATNYTPSASTVEGHLAGIDDALGNAGGADLVITKSAAEGFPRSNTSIIAQTGNFIGGTMSFDDAATGLAEWMFKFPEGATSVSDIKVYYDDQSVSVLQVYLAFYTTNVDTDSDGAAGTLDNSDTPTQYATGGTASRLKAITVPSAAYNLTGSGDEGDIFGLQVRRSGNDANDTYGAAWSVYAVEVTFA